MSKQIEALKLAEELERWLLVDAPTRVGVAAELRRLHAEIEVTERQVEILTDALAEASKANRELLEALELMVAGIENSVSNTYIPLVKARAAIAKAEGEQK